MKPLSLKVFEIQLDKAMANLTGTSAGNSPAFSGRLG